MLSNFKYVDTVLKGKDKIVIVCLDDDYIPPERTYMDEEAFTHFLHTEYSGTEIEQRFQEYLFQALSPYSSGTKILLINPSLYDYGADIIAQAAFVENLKNKILTDPSL